MPCCPYGPPPAMNVLPAPRMGRPASLGSRMPGVNWPAWTMVVAGTQLPLSAAPMEMPASSSMLNPSRTTVPLALAHTLATIAFSHAVPVQNWFVVQAAPHWPQLAGSLAVSTHWPPQHVTVDGPVHEACASHGNPGAASAASAPASSEPAS